MNSEQNLLLYFFAGVFAFGFLWRRREAIEHTVRQIAVAIVLAGIAFFLLWNSGLPPLTAYMVALLICVLIRRAQPRRSRYVSARTKRQAIAKHEKETGKTFKRGRDEFDHIVPHSRGGGNSEDNIQILPKKKNREKGARPLVGIGSKSSTVLPADMQPTLGGWLFLEDFYRNPRCDALLDMHYAWPHIHGRWYFVLFVRFDKMHTNSQEVMSEAR